MSKQYNKPNKQLLIKQVQELLDTWQSDTEIIKMLKIPHTTYYRIKKKIYQQDKKLLEKIRTDELEHRQIQVRKSLEYCIVVNKDICDNSKDDRARIDASAMIVKAQMGLLNLASEPYYNEQVRIIARETNVTRELEDKAMNEE